MSATIRDLFCGAGGSSLGGEMAGVELKHALNHWDRAIETHSLNFQNADHSCADIASLTTAKIRSFEPTDILWASPECTNHSLAKGGRRRPPQAASLFEDGPAGDAEQDRSRATMWDVVRFAEQAHLRGAPYKAIIVENVVDAVKWGYHDDGSLFNAWLMALRGVGYEHENVFLNSMMCWPTPQSRDRFYGVFWLRGMRKPNLAFEPPCWCPACEQIVNGRQTWKRPGGDPKFGRVWGRYGVQYFYTCPGCQGPALPGVYPAASVIDYELEAQRVGDRERPLAANTIERIRRGLERLASEPFAIRLMHGGAPKPLTLPLVTLTRRQDMAMVMPPMGGVDPRWDGLPLPTQTTTTRVGVVEMQNHGKVEADLDPLHTVRAGGQHHAVIMRNNGSRNENGEMVTSDMEAIRTLTTRGHQSVVIPYNRTGQPVRGSSPMPTVMTRACVGLVVPHGEAAASEPVSVSDAEIDDCRFRMFALDEIAGAMVMATHTDGEEYEVTGNKREKMAQYGNAVTPPAARDLVSRVLEVI